MDWRAGCGVWIETTVTKEWLTQGELHHQRPPVEIQGPVLGVVQLGHDAYPWEGLAAFSVFPFLGSSAYISMFLFSEIFNILRNII